MMDYLRFCENFSRSVFLVLCLYLAQPAAAQSDSNSFLGELTGLESLAENVIDHGMNRVDQSIISLGYAMRSFIASARVNGDQLIDKGSQEADTLRRNTVSSMMTLARVVLSDTEVLVEDSFHRMDSLTNTYYRSLRGDPLVSYVVVGDEDGFLDDVYQIDVRGAALSKAVSIKVNVDDGDVTPELIDRGDVSHKYKIDLSDTITRAHEGEVKTIPINVEMTYCEGIVRCKEKKKEFLTTLILMPEVLGNVTVTYQYTREKEVKKEHCSQDYESVRARSDFWGNSGRREDLWHLPVESGWVFDTASPPVLHFSERFKECDKTDSRALLHAFTETLITAKAITKTQSKPYVNCITRTRICAVQKKTTPETVTKTSNAVPLEQRNPLVIRLPERQARVSHILIASPFFEDKLLRVGARVGKFRVDYDEAIQTVFVSYGS